MTALSPIVEQTEVIQQELVASGWRLLERGVFSAHDLVEFIGANAVLFGQEKLFIAAITLALEHDATMIARQLADRGYTRYPESETLRQSVSGLAPAVSRRSESTVQSDFSGSMRWLSEHSHAYSGQWVALRNDMLLASANQYEELEQNLGDQINDPLVLITQIV